MGAPTRLVVVGAAAGIGRWLGDHVLAAIDWDAVTLLDTAPSILQLDHRYRGAVTRGRVAEGGGAVRVLDDAGETIELDAPRTAVAIAVPAVTLAAVAGWLLPSLAADAIVFDLSHDRVGASAIIRATRPELVAFGAHALFGTSAESADGQTFALCPDPSFPDAHRWLAEAIESAGAAINELTPERHDEIMGSVQTAAHQALLCFADVIGRSGFDLEQDLWANRTPVFELMLALASRVLAPGQEQTMASIQSSRGSAVASEFESAQTRLRDALSANSEAALIEHINGVRAPFTGGLFTKMQQAGALATSAVQSTRALIAEHRRAGDLVGIRSVDLSDRLHVGTIEHTSATSVTLRNLLVGHRGNAALLADDASTTNARRLGIGGRPRSVEFRLGRIRILGPAELEAELDGWLAQIALGCKFLVPESISGRSAVHVVESVERVERAELVSEEVRLGQRECVVRFWARADRALVDVEREIQQLIDRVFVWPDGVVLPVATGSVSTIGYLGPAGTFSDLAAQQLARLIGTADARRREYPDFPTLVDALAGGDEDLVVLPILSSSTGLVDLAAAVLAAAPPGVHAGGVLDVPVRFDAFVVPGHDLDSGATVYSHPQGIRQCSQFIAAQYLNAVECTSTAEACRVVQQQGHGIALAAPGIGEDFGLRPARASVGNLAGALTRFLVLGRESIFGMARPGDAISRSVWIVSETAGGLAGDDADDVRYDEIVRGPSGRILVVSTDAHRLTPGPGVRFVGTIPWSPRTPLVTV